MTKNELNQTVDQQSSYIVVSLSWDRKLILPIATGFKFLEIWATGIEVKTRSGQPTEIVEKTEDLSISFMTTKALKELKALQILDPPQDP